MSYTNGGISSVRWPLNLKESDTEVQLFATEQASQTRKALGVERAEKEWVVRGELF